MADLASTNRTALGKVRETTFGVIPPNPAFKAVRNTSSSLNANPQTVTSDEIRPDRQVTDLILVGQQAGGDVGGELSFRTHDDDFEEALQGTWANKPSIEVATLDTEISDVSATTLTVASGGAAFKPGHLTLTSGFDTAGNNKLARVSSSTATTVVYPAATFAAEAADVPVGASVRVIGFEGAAGDLAAVTIGGNALTSTVLDFTTLGILPGEWIKLGGGNAGDSFAAVAANNGWARVSKVQTNRLSFDRIPEGWAADAGTTKSIRIFVGDLLRNGSTKRSNTFERQYLDHNPVTYEYLRGMTLDKLSLGLDAQKIATITKTYIGRDGLVSTVRATGATDVAAPPYDVLNTSANVGRLGIDGAILTGPNFVMSAKIDVANNIRAQNAVGHLGAVGTGNGEFTVTGTLNTYFGDKTILDKIMSNLPTSFDARLGREDGNRETILVDLPRLKYSSGAPSIQGKNQDVMIDANFQAIRDPLLGYTMAVQRYWFLPAA